MELAQIRTWVAGWANSRFFARQAHQSTSRGTSSRGLPIVLDRNGLIDTSFMADPLLVNQLGVDTDTPLWNAHISALNAGGKVVALAVQNASNDNDTEVAIRFVNRSSEVNSEAFRVGEISVDGNSGASDFVIRLSNNSALAEILRLSAAGTLTLLGALVAGGTVAVGGKLRTSRESLTISNGAITPTTSFVLLTGQGSVSDDLTTINGGITGDHLFIRPNTGTGTITVKDGLGNLQLAGDFAMTNTNDLLHLMCIGTGSTWNEISRGDNA